LRVVFAWQEHWDDAALWNGDAAGVGAWSLLGSDGFIDVDEPEPQGVVALALAHQPIAAANDDDDFATGEVTAPTLPGLGGDNVVVALAHLPPQGNPQRRAAIVGLVVLALIALSIAVQPAAEEEAVVVVVAPAAPVVTTPIVTAPTVEAPLAKPEEPHCVRPPKVEPKKPVAAPTKTTPAAPTTTPTRTPTPPPVQGSSGRERIAILDVSGDDTSGAQRTFAKSARAALQKAGYDVDAAAAAGLKLRITKLKVTEGSETTVDVDCDAVVVKLPERFLRGSARGSVASAGDLPADELVDDAVAACAQQVIEGASAQLRRGAAD
jgi:outer membrane biosynthesis protein TonB